MISGANLINGSNNTPNKLSMIMTNGANANVVLFAADGTAAGYNIASATAQFVAVTATNYILSTVVTGANVITYRDRALVTTAAGTWSGSFHAFLGYFTGSLAANTDISDIVADWILVRQHAATVPTTANGAEEAACL